MQNMDDLLANIPKHHCYLHYLQTILSKSLALERKKHGLLSQLQGSSVNTSMPRERDHFFRSQPVCLVKAAEGSEGQICSVAFGAGIAKL